MKVETSGRRGGGDSSLKCKQRKELPVMWIVHYMRWIMLVSGVLTATMVQAAITPDAALQSDFGET